MRSVLKTVKNFELNNYKIPKEILDITKTTVTNSLDIFLNKNKHLIYIDKYILNEYSKCKKFLRENDVFVTKADKGQVTVIMDKNIIIFLK